MRHENSLSARENDLQEENASLRKEVERFNSKLIEEEEELERLKQELEDAYFVLRQLNKEDVRLPLFQPRNALYEQRVAQCRSLTEQFHLDPPQEVHRQHSVALNIWLTTQNRFVDRIFGHYIRQRDHVLAIHKYDLVKRLISFGFLPDIIITGAYDFGLDDPTHQAFFEFLDQVFNQEQQEDVKHELFIITLSSTVPAQSSVVSQFRNYSIRHEFVSKFRGLQVTVSEVRFFLEMRRCRQDIMAAELFRKIEFLEEVDLAVLEIQADNRTGLVVVLSDEEPKDVRWAFQLFFLEGRLVKAEHTLESLMFFPNNNEASLLEQIVGLSSRDSQYQLNPPRQLFFFPLHQSAVLHEIRQEQFSTQSM